MRARSFALAFLSVIFLAACGKREAPTAPATSDADVRNRHLTPSDAIPLDSRAIAGFDVSFVDLDQSSFKDYSIERAAFKTEAHKKYLSDPMKFTALPDQAIPKGDTAVVGSRVCKFYPNAELVGSADLGKLPAGVDIPFGTILPIDSEKVANETDSEHNGMFSFQDNWNWFYPTTYKGKKGLVFGADLYGLGDTNENNRVSARLYQTGGAYDAFYPIAGYRALSKDISSRIERDRIAIQAVDSYEYRLSIGGDIPYPDDMISLYMNHDSWSTIKGWNRKTPIFVTTDLAAHVQHLMFDRTLQFLEEALFAPRLFGFCDRFLAKLEERKADSDGYGETLDKAILYFQVAKALLVLAPERVQTDSYGGVVYREKDAAAMLADYPQAVRDEIVKMDKAAGFEVSSVFSFADGTVSKEDYSQYKPRGHYTKNGALAAYFRAMTWFGRIHFLIADAGPAPLLDRGPASGSTALTLAMEPIALLVTDLVRSDEGLYESWRQLFDPITALIGLADDLSFKEVLPLWRDQKVSEKEFGDWVGKKENLIAFMNKAHEKLRPPAISGSSVWWGPSEGTGKVEFSGDIESVDRRPPMGWRLFGQRFTYDSAVHQQVSPPRLRSRDVVRGLDIMKAFGSRTADSMLGATDYPKMAGLEDKLDALEKDFDAYGQDFWQKTYYNGVLSQVRAQARFEPGAGFYFTETPAWGAKAMLSAHGTWCELRHDTILYAKQNYAERAGDGDFEPTFRTEPIPEPVHYIEPNLPFWQSSVMTVQKLLKTLDEFKLLDEETAQDFGRLREIFAEAVDIAALETQDKPVASKDVAWIASIPNELTRLALTHVDGRDIEDVDQLRMALVADVFTNAELEKVLETAVGIPYRIYVALNDGQGGKRIAVGYVFSYYEFDKPMSERMTDEEWKKIVYGPAPELGGYLPFWAKGIALPPEAAASDGR
jgi:hypothetical protein